MSQLFDLSAFSIDPSTPRKTRRQTLREAAQKEILGLLGQHDINEIPRRDESGRLLLDTHFLSVSYCKDVGVVAIASVPIGIDLEYENPVKDWRKLGVFLWREEPQSREHFFEKFCSMEAYGKLIGEGISAKSRKAFASAQPKIDGIKLSHRALNAWHLALAVDSTMPDAHYSESLALTLSELDSLSGTPR